jgi:DNA-binding transcriptional MerR regulator
VEDRAYLSIGEVLSLLKEEFPDVTISKIRFLESQGLLDPERTPSGYRKFYETDVDRLRWILRQQREHFLPLKVIKGRLRGGEDAANEDGLDPEDGAGTSEPANAVAAQSGSVAAPAQSAVSGSPGSTPGSTPGGTGAPTPPPPTPSYSSGPQVRYELPSMSSSPSGESLTLGELAAASGLDEDLLRELEKFGLLVGRKVAQSVYYDEEAIIVATLAAGFMKYGVEARHLRMYKTAGEREAGFFEQVVMPMLKQRNPEARKQATEALAELTNLGQGLRSAMLRQSLRHYFEG